MVFLAGGQSPAGHLIARSTDGKTWSAVSTPWDGPASVVKSIAYHDGVFVAAGRDSHSLQIAMVSTDGGNTWLGATAVVSATTTARWITWAGGHWLIGVHDTAGGGQDFLVDSINLFTTFGMKELGGENPTAPWAAAAWSGQALMLVQANAGESSHSINSGFAFITSGISSPTITGAVIWDGATFVWGGTQGPHTFGTPSSNLGYIAGSNEDTGLAHPFNGPAAELCAVACRANGTTNDYVVGGVDPTGVKVIESALGTFAGGLSGLTPRTTPLDGGRVQAITAGGGLWVAGGHDSGLTGCLMWSPTSVAWTASPSPLDGGIVYALATDSPNAAQPSAPLALRLLQRDDGLASSAARLGGRNGATSAQRSIRLAGPNAYR